MRTLGPIQIIHSSNNVVGTVMFLSILIIMAV